MASGLCPNCGTPRTGSFRFCRSCGLDYDAVPMNASNPVAPVRAPEPGSDGPPKVVAPTADAIPATALEDRDPIPPEAPIERPAAETAETPAAETSAAIVSAAPSPPADAIVIEKRRLRQWLGAFIGILIGAMLMGAIVVPFFDHGLIVIGIAAGIGLIAVLAWLGARIAAGPVRKNG